MKIEIPQFKRCCLCVPLRRGLLAWVYLKLISDILLVSLMSISLYYTAQYSGPFRETVYEASILSACLLDIILAFIFIVGGHMKNFKLLKVYYYYSIVEGVVTACLCVGQFGWMIYFMCNYSSRPFFYHYLIFSTSTAFITLILSLMLQFYFICLIRSEIIKLETNVQVKFVKAVTNNSDVIVETEKMEKLKYDRLDDVIYNV